MALTTLQAAMSGVTFALQAAATTGAGTVLAIPPSFRNHNFEVQAATGVTAGVVSLEASSDPNYAGTWAVLGTITTSAAGDTLTQVTGILQFVRARITTTISGGGAPSVNVNYVGAKSY